MRLRRRRLIATFGVLLMLCLATAPGIQAATPPEIAADAATLEVPEGQVAEMGGTFTEADGDTVDLTASVGTIEVDPDDAARWIWTLTTTDGPADTEVTVTATDGDGSGTDTFTLTVTNVAPTAWTTGPKYVPVLSASDREFLWSADDVAADDVTTDVDCGEGVVTSTGDSDLPDVKTVHCTFPVGMITPVGVVATDEDGGTTDGRITVRASANIASVADGDVVVNGVGGDQLGGTVAVVDIDDNGKGDIAIGSTSTSGGGPVVDPGYVMVAKGRATFGTVNLGSLSNTAGFRIDGPASAGFGRALGSAGDVNGDGVADLLIGAEGAAGGKGIVYVVFGKTTIDDLNVTTMTAAQGAKITGAAVGSATGRTVLGVGDVNGDGKADIALGSPGLDAGDGAAYILFGGTSFTDIDLAALSGSRGIKVTDAGFSSGSSLGAGDVNGDGKADVVIGSRLGSDSNATVIYGKATLSDIDASPLASGDGFRIGGSEDLGINAVGAGDMDGDGFAEVVLLHPNWDDGGQWAGSIVRGAATNASIAELGTASRDRVLRITSPDEEIGLDLSLFDNNGDGLMDAIFGANLTHSNGEAAGSAFLLRGTEVLADVEMDVLDSRWRRIDGDNLRAFAGDGVAGGDISGDGIGDIIVGAPGATTWDADTLPGRLGVFFGDPPDVTKPKVTTPTRSIPNGKALSGSSPIVRISFKGSDTESGVEHFDIAQQTNNGSWVAVISTPATHLDKALATGKDYQFRVRAVDVAGNKSAWKYGTQFHLSGYQDTSSKIKYSGKWKVGTSASYAGGTTRYSSSSGKQASLTFSGRQVVFAAPTGPTRGSAKVYINGKYSKTISLYSSTAKPSKVIASWSWSSKATRTITVRVSGTSGHGRVDVDKLIVVK